MGEKIIPNQQLPIVPPEWLQKPPEETHFENVRRSLLNSFTTSQQRERRKTIMNAGIHMKDTLLNTKLNIGLHYRGSLISSRTFARDLDATIFLDRDSANREMIAKIRESLGLKESEILMSAIDEKDIREGTIHTLGYNFKLNSADIDLRITTIENALYCMSLSESHRRINRKRVENVDLDNIRPTKVTCLNGDIVYLLPPVLQLEKKDKVIDISLPGIMDVPSRNTLALSHFLLEILSGVIQFDKTAGQIQQFITKDIWHEVTVAILKQHNLINPSGTPKPEAYDASYIVRLFPEKEKFSRPYIKNHLETHYFQALNRIENNILRRKTYPN